MEEWITQLFADRQMLRMGHLQRADDRNLGLGWLYYGLARVIRSSTAVVIGSYRGFVPVVLAKALADNVEHGRVVFIDPSFVDDFWKDPAAVRAHFDSFQATNISHFLMTTQQFVESEHYAGIGEVGVLFVDGLHSQAQARFDFEAFAPKLAANGVALFHDTVSVYTSDFYGDDRKYECDVQLLMRELEKRSDLQVLDLPFGSGVTLVRRHPDRPGIVQERPGPAAS